MAVAKKSYAKSGAFSEPSLEDKLKTQANSPSGHANIRGIVRKLSPYTDEAVETILAIMRDKDNRPSACYQLTYRGCKYWSCYQVHLRDWFEKMITFEPIFNKRG